MNIITRHDQIFLSLWKEIKHMTLSTMTLSSSNMDFFTFLFWEETYNVPKQVSSIEQNLPNQNHSFELTIMDWYKMKYFVYFHSTLLNSDPNHRISSEPVNSNLFHRISQPNRKYNFGIHFRFAQRLKIGYF